MSSVERSLLRGKRDRKFGSVSCSQHEQERILFEKKNLHEYKEKQNELVKLNVQLRKDYLKLRLK